jgi:hypothetical protein
MGFEGQLFIGTAGTTAATQVTNLSDLNYNADFGKGNTTVRGTGAAPPIETEEVTSIKISGVEWTMINDITDTALQTILAAAYSGGRLAVRTKDYSTGKGIDADMTIKVEHGEPLNGEQTYKFSATPTRGAGRTPQLYV